LKIEYLLEWRSLLCFEEWRIGDTYIWNMLVQISAVPVIGNPLSVRIIWFEIHLKTARNQEVQYKSWIYVVWIVWYWQELLFFSMLPGAVDLGHLSHSGNVLLHDTAVADNNTHSAHCANCKYRHNKVRASTWCCGNFVIRTLRKTHFD
jgi:hypothetical protein